MAYNLPIKPRKIINLAEEIAYLEGVQLTGVVCKRDKEGWLIVVKATLHNQPVVHFTGGRTYADAWEVLCWEIDHHQVNWRPDKFAK